MAPTRTTVSPNAVADCAAEGYSRAQQAVQRLDEDAFAKVVAFIGGNISQPISIRDLSRLVGISRHHFSRRFKLKAGMSPYAFITICRMDLAGKLLLETSLSHEQIAEQVGYCHVGHFRKQFRRRFGINPSDVRQIVAAA